ncbi:MAG: hypothetical protein JRH15_17710 [Deltaproteobacteria bacterium]|nr:hypothetical protein [Deltaproteobacteria bacterium]
MDLKHAVESGFSFGITSGIITTLGLIVGLHSGSHAKGVIISGVLTIAIADALSDALGMHMVEESEGKHSEAEIWWATAATFLSKFIFTLSFLIPLIIFPLFHAIVISLVWGFALLFAFSFYLARKQRITPIKVAGEHLLIAVVVIVLTHFTGRWIGSFFA